MNEEIKGIIADYYEPWELVEFLGKKLSTRDIIDAFEDEVEDSLDEIEEDMGINNE